MPADIPKYALRPHSFERLAHPVQHIAGARRAPALLYVVFPVPRFIARTVLDESRLVFRRCLASEANIRKTSLTTPESESASRRRPTDPLPPPRRVRCGPPRGVSRLAWAYTYARLVGWRRARRRRKFLTVVCTANTAPTAFCVVPAVREQC